MTIDDITTNSLPSQQNSVKVCRHQFKMAELIDILVISILSFRRCKHLQLDLIDMSK